MHAAQHVELIRCMQIAVGRAVNTNTWPRHSMFHTACSNSMQLSPHQQRLVPHAFQWEVQLQASYLWASTAVGCINCFLEGLCCTQRPVVGEVA
jgi:hypothetical protein